LSSLGKIGFFSILLRKDESRDLFVSATQPGRWPTGKGRVPQHRVARYARSFDASLSAVILAAVLGDQHGLDLVETFRFPAPFNFR